MNGLNQDDGIDLRQVVLSASALIQRSAGTEIRVDLPQGLRLLVLLFVGRHVRHQNAQPRVVSIQARGWTGPDGNRLIRLAATTFITLGTVATLGVSPCHGAPASTQTKDGTGEGPGWQAEVHYLGANLLIAGLGAGVAARISGNPVFPALLKGALGGVVGYGGRRIAARRFDGAGFLGRQVGALGASITRNGAEGRKTFERFIFPAGPFEFRLDRFDGSVTTQFRIDPAALAIAGSLLLREDAKIDWRESLSAGTFVFWMSEEWAAGTEHPSEGTTVDRTILAFRGSDVPADDILAHERIHVLQNDYLFLAFGDMVQSWAFSQDRILKRCDERISLNVFIPAVRWAVMHGFDIDYPDRPTEQEAGFLSRR